MQYLRRLEMNSRDTDSEVKVSCADIILTSHNGGRNGAKYRGIYTFQEISQWTTKNPACFGVTRSHYHIIPADDIQNPVVTDRTNLSPQ
jgi:hypothetical protein